MLEMKYIPVYLVNTMPADEVATGSLSHQGSNRLDIDSTG